MLLAVDIGNTSITFGVFKDSKLIKTFRISSKIGTVPAQLVATHRDCPYFGAAIICSVVPKLTPVIEKRVRRLFKIKPIVVGRDVNLTIKNRYKNPKQVGQDRLVDAIAAKELYGAPVIIVDSGTAITFDYVSEKGDYEGGVIVPGIDLSLNALYERTALLPHVKLKDDKGLTLIGRDTVNSIKSGLLHGFGSLADGLTGRIRARYGKEITVIGTGGYIGFIKKYSHSIDIIDYYLTLKGLRIIYEKNCLV